MTMSIYDDDYIGIFDKIEQDMENERKKREEVNNKVKQADWCKFYDMGESDETDKLFSSVSFPIKIYSDSYVSLSSEEVDDINNSYVQEATYLEQSLARREGYDGDADIEGTECRQQYYESYKGSYTFTFHAYYLEIYKALKGLDKIMGTTNFAALFIETLIACGLNEKPETWHPILRATMAGVRYNMYRELALKEKSLKCNEKRRRFNEQCHLPLHKLIDDDTYKLQRIFNEVKGTTKDD